jgi:hypothetical protein
MKKFVKLLFVFFFSLFFIQLSLDLVIGAGTSSCGSGCPNSQTCQICSIDGCGVQTPNGCGTSTHYCCVRPNNSCNRPGITQTCPAGTVRSSVILSNVCQGICTLGNAQTQGACCDTVCENPSNCDLECTYNPRTGNNRCKKVCQNPGGCYCRTAMLRTHRCDPICTSTSPTAVTLLSPDPGASVSTQPVLLQWGGLQPAQWGAKCPAPNVNNYNVYVGTTNPPNTTTDLRQTNTATSYGFTGTPGTTYYWRVGATNGGTTTYSAVRSFTILNNQISGRVYLDANNTCSTATPWTTGGVAISVDGGAGTAISGTGTYTVTAAQGTPHTVAVSLPSGYACSTGAGCNTCTKTGILPGTANAANNNFFLSNLREGWWQVSGAGIYVGGSGSTDVTVRSNMPSSSMRLILAESGGTAAALLRGSGSSDLGTGSVSDSLWTTTAKYKGKKMDYQYFAAQMGVLPNQESIDWGADTMNKPGTTKDFHYIDPQSGTATVSSLWTVLGNEKYVVFVNGDLVIDANTDVDENGGFLAFIVNGNITVSPSVTQMEGIFIASNNFATETVDSTGVIADDPLLVEGTVVSWGSFGLRRSLINDNITTPAETFSYRPDLLENMPDKMKTFAMNWQEVAPGTFGE